MNKRYHLIIENTKVDHPYFNPDITLTLIDTLSRAPVFELRIFKEYLSAIEELILTKYKDNVIVYDTLDAYQKR